MLDNRVTHPRQQLLATWSNTVQFLFSTYIYFFFFFLIISSPPSPPLWPTQRDRNALSIPGVSIQWNSPQKVSQKAYLTMRNLLLHLGLHLMRHLLRPQMLRNASLVHLFFLTITPEIPLKFVKITCGELKPTNCVAAYFLSGSILIPVECQVGNNNLFRQHPRLPP